MLLILLFIVSRLGWVYRNASAYQPFSSGTESLSIKHFIFGFEVLLLFDFSALSFIGRQNDAGLLVASLSFENPKLKTCSTGYLACDTQPSMHLSSQRAFDEGGLLIIVCAGQSYLQTIQPRLCNGPQEISVAM